MSKRKNTLLVLEAALERIILSQTKRIPIDRKLSIRAVEEEASLGNGTGHYYPEFIEKYRQAKSKLANENNTHPRSDIERLRAKVKQEAQVKEKYKQEKDALKNLIASMAAEHHHFSDALRKAHLKIDELTEENHELKDKLVAIKRQKIFDINSLD
ncbi:hypothetical protein [Shewanella baltica]|uniref:hypothetical protein n=1 Tax=Shewanella baltica TaxID=62322 RepID=UPI00217F0622|nr:hypothetical protein [Shewanella baltica]MCS6159818.1 hypothetical protein [Shewanella baltica]